MVSINHQLIGRWRQSIVKNDNDNNDNNRGDVPAADDAVAAAGASRTARGYPGTATGKEVGSVDRTQSNAKLLHVVVDDDDDDEDADDEDDNNNMGGEWKGRRR